MAGKEFDYKILSFAIAEEMEVEIKTMLRDGWELHGDLKVIAHSASGAAAEVQYIQAMVKDVTPRGRTGFRTSMQD